MPVTCPGNQRLIDKAMPSRSFPSLRHPDYIMTYDHVTSNRRGATKLFVKTFLQTEGPRYLTLLPPQKSPLVSLGELVRAFPLLHQ